MFQFLNTYRKIVIVLLTIILAIPCSVKRDLKQQFNIESNQSAKNNSAKIGCASFCSSYIKSNKKEKQQVFLDKKGAIAIRLEGVIDYSAPEMTRGLQQLIAE
ncbi:hypothetical protein [Moheibacter stercoris]|uniref:Uncharacterized protein n=1 Tax=Moheibacter stercoris TaxID=1628251 RepID=A0ABV2LWY7_9FLAO